MMKTNQRGWIKLTRVVIRPKWLHVLVFLGALLLTQTCFAWLRADIKTDGVVDFGDLTILANEWLEDSNEISLKPKADINTNGAVNFEDLAILANEWLKDSLLSLSLVRDSIAYDANFQRLPVNTGRYEAICIASRPTVSINRNVDRLVQDIDGNMIICSDFKPVYTTTDGNTFTKLFDISTSNDFVGYYEVNDDVRSVKVMPDGSWLLSFGKMNQGGWGSGGHLFRSVDKGLSWTHVLEYERGYTDYFGWWAISNNEVAIGEYGYLNEPTNNPRRIYYSDDYGATWSKIYEPPPAAEHCHFVAFKPGNTNVIYASYDCPANSLYPSNHRVIKLIYTIGAGGKRNIANWSEAPNSPILTQGNLPVCAFSDGKYLYLGHDGGMSPVLWRLNPEDDSVVPVMDWPQYYNDLNHPYVAGSLRAQVFGMVMYEGVYYAAVKGVIDFVGGGIYVSTDGEHWACAYRVEGVDGFQNILGFTNGYLWGTYMEAGRRKIYKMSPVRAELVKALCVERGITNQLNTPASSSFEGSNCGWVPTSASDVNLAKTGASTEMALDGNSSYKIVCERKGFKTIDILSGYCPVRPALGDYICASFWIKGAPTWPDDFIGIARFASSGGKIDLIEGYFDIRQHQDWEQITVWGRCTDANFINGVCIWLGLRDLGYTGDYSNATCYVDCAQMVYFSDLHYSGSWQIGGTPRANEVATDSLVGLGVEFTTVLEWKPQRSRREWHGNIYIASWTDGQEYIDLYYDNNSSRFVATDGTNTAITNQIFSWDIPDSIKFAFTNMDGDFRLSVQTPLNGVEHVLTDKGGTKLGPPVAVTFGTDSQRTGYGCGLIMSIKHFNSALSVSEIQQIFDLVETADR